MRIKLNTGEYDTLVTNLPRDEITVDDIRELYKARWGIELAFREIKYGLNLVLLHGKSDELMSLVSKFVEPIRPDRSDKRKIRPQGFRDFVYRVPA